MSVDGTARTSHVITAFGGKADTAKPPEWDIVPTRFVIVVVPPFAVQTKRMMKPTSA
jgi:hypothetical protein